MMNCATIMGRLTADPELRVAASGKEVCRFTVAVDRPTGDKVTDFIKVICFGKTATFVSRYFHKGSMISVHGRIQTGSYTDDKGIKRYTVEIVPGEVSFCGEKREPSPSEQRSDTSPEGRGKENHTGSGYYSTAAPGDFEEITDEEELPY